MTSLTALGNSHERFEWYSKYRQQVERLGRRVRAESSEWPMHPDSAFEWFTEAPVESDAIVVLHTGDRTCDLVLEMPNPSKEWFGIQPGETKAFRFGCRLSDKFAATNHCLWIEPRYGVQEIVGLHWSGPQIILPGQECLMYLHNPTKEAWLVPSGERFALGIIIEQSRTI